MAWLELDDVLAKAPIEDVARKLGLELKQSGDGYRALCPFHPDNKPSLQFFRDTRGGHFHCFACQEHGNAISLAKQVLGTDFKGAVEWLDSSFGVPLRTSLTERRKANLSGTAPEPPRSTMEEAQRIYKEKSIKERLDIWAQERHLSQELVASAELSYARENTLSQYAGSLQRNEALPLLDGLETANLIRRLFSPRPTEAPSFHLSLAAGYSDFFSANRIIIPLRDGGGRLRGFAGRLDGAVPDEKTPKYLFSKGLPKGEFLYYADKAFIELLRRAKAGQERLNLYLVEGFFDALRLNDLGHPAAAVMGTGITRLQAEALQRLTERLPKNCELVVNVLLDRDTPGIRGAGKICTYLWGLADGIDVQVTFLSDEQLRGIGAKTGKDPDECFREVQDGDALRRALEFSSYPAAVAFIVQEFGTDDPWRVIDNDRWYQNSLARRTRALRQVSRILSRRARDKSSLTQLALGKFEEDASATPACLKDLLQIILEPASQTSGSGATLFIAHEEARLNHARLLAYAGAKRGELPCAEPEWDRLDIAATGFNLLLKERLTTGQVEAVAPFDAVRVPRKFGGSEPRLKAMPRPADLVLQQFLLNELLTERYDDLSIGGAPFSAAIPAVRHFSEEGRTTTTGVRKIGASSEFEEVKDELLSFAYQVDMEVLEGRRPPTDQGMFRPYMQCWRDFMHALQERANDIGLVHCIRLDVSRYYDRLQRFVVRDSLLPQVREALSRLSANEHFLSGILDEKNKSSHDRAAFTVDTICDSLFGHKYFDPADGQLESFSEDEGIPQGPILSAWVGNVALFSVDDEARRLLARFNVDRRRIGYVRYVDDIVLVADSADLLNELRSAIEHSARSIGLALVAKADGIPVLTAKKFYERVNEGRVFTVSGPAWEPPLIGNGELGWDIGAESIQLNRQSALQILRHPGMLRHGEQEIVRSVHSAFAASDLRPSELAKGARWLWHVIAGQMGSGSAVDLLSDEVIWQKYWEMWGSCCANTGWVLDASKRPWDDPLLFALEGLEKLFCDAAHLETALTSEEIAAKRNGLDALAKRSAHEAFLMASGRADTCLLQTQLRARWKLIQWRSHRRSSVATPEPDESSTTSPARSMNVWLDHAIRRLMTTAPNASDEWVDPLEPLQKILLDDVRWKGEFPNSWALASSLLKSPPENTTTQHSRAAALQCIVAVCPKESLWPVLNHRPHLLAEGGGEELLTFPPLPGVDQDRLLACKTLAENGTGEFDSLVAVELPGMVSALPDIFGGTLDEAAAGAVLSPAWSAPDIGQLVIRSGALPNGLKLKAWTRPPYWNEGFRPHLAAKLFRALISAQHAYWSSRSDQSRQKELIPAWPYIALAYNADEPSHCYLICEAVATDRVASRAFVRDARRSLRGIGVPNAGGYIWRAGVTVTDVLGLQDDVNKLAEHDVAMHLEESDISSPDEYVLRSQLRKLRGSLYSNRILQNIDEVTELPRTVSRALTILENFPSTNAMEQESLLSLLETEAETEAMRLRLARNADVDSKGLRNRLHVIADAFSRRLPVALAERLNRSSNELSIGLRRDLDGLARLTSKLLSNAEWDDREHDAACAIKLAFVLATCASAYRGFVASLLASRSLSVPIEYQLPDDWKKADAVASDIEGGFTRLRNSLMGQDWVGLSDSTPMSWLLLVVTLLEAELRLEPFQKVRSNLKEVYLLLLDYETTPPSADEQGWAWPFEDLPSLDFTSYGLGLVKTVCECIAQLDELCSLQVSLVSGSQFRYTPQTNRFTDSQAETWEMDRTRFSQFPNKISAVEEECIGGRIRRLWSEVRQKGTGKLLSIHALDIAASRIAFGGTLKAGDLHSGTSTEASSTSELLERAQNEATENTKNPTAEVLASTAIVAPAFLAAVQEKSVIESASRGDETPLSAEVNDDSSSTTIVESPTQPPAASAPPQNSSSPEAPAPRALKGAQQFGWNSRKSKSKAHLRVALMQWRLDESYSHPLKDAGLRTYPSRNSTHCDELGAHLGQIDLLETYTKLHQANSTRGCEHLWNESAYLISWAEHRRRRLLREAIKACDRLGVELLVLPEYSLRPDTIHWLKTEALLSSKGLAVLAGTYRRSSGEGTAKEMLRAEMHLLWSVPESVLAVIAEQSAAEGSANGAKIENGLILEWSRGKKYRAVAMDEYFNPETRDLAPLFSLDHLHEIFTQNGIHLGAPAISQLLTSAAPGLRYCQEVICSELFMLASPANINSLGDDYSAQCKRFGLNHGNGVDKVIEDMLRLSESLSITREHTQPRRSVLLVPAATSRSADYWIAGQASLLASGTTTVFCNGVLGREFLGGSCFVGRDSWVRKDKAVGMIGTSTPYHGWSKGIYYNDRRDALSDSDQAMVVVDIDPVNMLEGKPRPQLLPIPMQLVSYLPIAELLNTETNSTHLISAVRSHLVERGQNIEAPTIHRLTELEAVLKSESSSLKSPESFDKSYVGMIQSLSNGSRRDADNASELFSNFFSDRAAIKSRMNVMLNDRLQQPMHLGLEPAMYDYLPVDLTLKPDETLPRIRVDAWSELFKAED